MKTVEIIFVSLIFSISLIYALRVVIGPFFLKKGDNLCKYCPMAGKCEKK
ncbi:MAG: hypothetical protein PHX30_05980 [Candidatus Pacebacteria bacterium]|nr:hypothetical protein [Candidatus Paceibacterota bacterium]